jgi:hypothetical protein
MPIICQTELVDVSDLLLGDIVVCFDGAYGFGTVQRIDLEDGSAEIFRPYVHVGLQLSKSAITYIGTETFHVYGKVKKLIP